MRGHIRKRAGRFQTCVYVGAGPDGKGKRYHYQTFDTEREAEAALAQELNTPGRVQPSKLTVADYLRSWLKDTEHTRKPSTQISYKDEIERHLIPGLGAIRLDRLAPAMVNPYIAEELKSVSKTSVKYYCAILASALADAYEEKLIPANIMAKGGGVRMPQASDYEGGHWDEEHRRLFLAAAKGNGDGKCHWSEDREHKHLRGCRYYLAFLVNLYAGMREGELFGVRWDDIDLLTGDVTVRQHIQRKGGRLLVGTPKSKRGKRTFRLPEQVLVLLREHRKQQVTRRLALGSDYKTGDGTVEWGDLVFCQDDGKPEHAHNIVRRHFHAICRLAGIPPIRFHETRDTVGTIMADNGATAQEIADQLGDTVAVVMDRYVHKTARQRERAVRFVEGTATIGGD